MSRRLSHLSCALVGAIVYCSGTVAEAAKIGSPRYDLAIWGITTANPVHPLANSGERPLLSASDADAVGGRVILDAVVGSNSNGDASSVQAGVWNDGDTFAVQADSPSHYQRATDYVGSAAEVNVYQSFRKDSADARLTYTYTLAEVFAIVDPETSGLCPLADNGFCLRAEILSRVSVNRGDGSTSAGDQVWARVDGALVGSKPTFPNIDGIVTGDWPWAIDNNPLRGTLGARVSLNSQTQEVDLSGIAVGEEFTMWYQLYAYAYDLANLYDVAIGWKGRTAFALAKDPLGGDTGVSFDITGLTPTNNPILPAPIPEPQTWAMLAAGLGLLIAIGRRRQLAPG